MTLTSITVIAGFASAAFWLIGSILSFFTGGSYFGGPPPHIVRMITISNLCNSLGALLAAISIAAQAYALS